MKTSDILKRYGIKLKRSLGQNFLSDSRIAKRIVEIAGVDGEIVVEIGTGSGVLTVELAKVAKTVYTFEIDRSLQNLLSDVLKDFDNVKVFFEDFLKADLSFLNKGFSYVANIPYSITGPIIEKILREGRFKKAVLMVQKEVGDRITAKPGSKTFGYLSALVQTFCDVEKIFRVSKSHFVPNPEVDSVVVKFIPKKNGLDFKSYRKFLSVLFSKKRKTIKNNLKGLINNSEEFLVKFGFDPMKRPEELPVDELVKLYTVIKEQSFLD